MARQQQSSKPAAKAARTTATPASSGVQHLYIAAAILFGLVLLAFYGAFSNQFLRWDDHLYIYENPFIKNPSGAGFMALAREVVANNYHPLTMWSLWLNAKLFGAGPQSFIVANVVLHALNTVLAFVFVWLISGRRFSVALITALLFGLHPLRVESVAWISERKDVLYVFFFLLGAINYWRYLESERKRFLHIAFLFMLLSCLSKGVAVVFPVVCLLLDYWKARSWSVKLLVEKASMFGVAFLIGIISVAAQGGHDFGGFLSVPPLQKNALEAHFSLFDQLRYAGYGFMMYFVKLVWPMNLSPLYPYPASEEQSKSVVYVLGLVFMLGVLGATVWAFLKNKRLAAFSLLFFWVTILLVLRFFSVGSSIMADRYMYLPSIGLFFWAAYGLEVNVLKTDNARRFWWAVAGVLALFYVVQTRTQVQVWANNETLWKQVIKIFPDNDQARDVLGNYYGRLGRMDEAMAQFETAVKDGCLIGDTWGGLANSYSYKAMQPGIDPATRDKYRQKAQEYYDKANTLEPDDADRYYDQALACYTYNPSAAVGYLDNAIRYNPLDKPMYEVLKGLSLLNLQRAAEAVQILNSAISGLERLPPADRMKNYNSQIFLAYLNRGLARAGSGDQQGGISDIEKSLQIFPGNAEAAAALQKIKGQ